MAKKGIIDAFVDYSGKTLSVGQCNFSNRVFKKGVSFKGTTFKGKANFENSEFHWEPGNPTEAEIEDYGEVDFSNAIFEDGASFEGAVFINNGKDVKFDGAWFKPSKKNVTFENAQFGNKYQNSYGEWEIRFIRFVQNKKDYYQITGWKPESGKAKPKPESISGEDDIPGILAKWDVPEKSHASIKNTFTIFLSNPIDVSFKNALFGELEIENKDKLPEKRIKEIIGKEKELIPKYLKENQRGELAEKLSSYEEILCGSPVETDDASRAAVINILSRSLERDEIKALRKDPEMNVSFKNAAFSNGGNVSFESAAFSNGGAINFNKASFSNSKYVYFKNTTFANGGGVSFESAAFSNVRGVSFNNAAFSNGGAIWFLNATFSNGGGVWFDDAAFSNGGAINFNKASFSNGGYVKFYRAFFSNGRSVGFSSTAFSNGGYVHFNRVAFSNGGRVNFNKVAFSNGGYVSFNRVAFSNVGRFSFSGSVFRNKGEVVFKNSVWVNGGGFNFSGTKFDDEINARFDQSIFLCDGKLNFANSRLPREGSFRFMNCHVGDIKRPDGHDEPKVDFKNVYFRHAVFEGGGIGWLKGKSEKERAIRAILDVKNIKPPKEVDDWIKKLEEDKKDVVPETTDVFDDDVVVSWKGITSESAKNITFRLVNLSRSLFDGMTLSHVELNAPMWKSKYGFDPKYSVFGEGFTYKNYGRSILYEEEVVKGRFKNEDPQINNDYRRQLEGLENQYTQLKTNLEKQGNYRDAGEAHYGEKEMRRLGMIWIRRWFGLLRMYDIFTGYGERPLKAGFWVAVLTFILVPYAIFHFQDSSAVLPLKTFSEDYYEVVVELITPFSWRKAIDPTGKLLWPKHFILIIGQILLFIQIPLFVMAVRRRFKR